MLCCYFIGMVDHSSFLADVDTLLVLGVVVQERLVERLVGLAVVVGQDLQVQLWDPYLLVVYIHV